MGETCVLSIKSFVVEEEECLFFYQMFGPQTYN